MAFCCSSLIPLGAHAVPRPLPLRVNGVEIPTWWPSTGEDAQDYTHERGRTNYYPFRFGPWKASAAEPEWAAVGGSFLPGTQTPNPKWIQRQREMIFHAHKAGDYAEVGPFDEWGFKRWQWGDAIDYIDMPPEDLAAFGHTWTQNMDNWLDFVAENVVCLGNVLIDLGNEADQIPGYDPDFYRKYLASWRAKEQKYKCTMPDGSKVAFVHMVGGSVPELFGEVDYTITHSVEALTAPLGNRWTINNERGKDFPPAVDQDRFARARNKGLAYGYWRGDQSDADFEESMARRKAVVDGETPPSACTLPTPTARELVAAGEYATLKVQRTTAAYGIEPQDSKWITATPWGCFGKDYYCAIGWTEACNEGRQCGPVAPDGHPARLACEDKFLEIPCPRFSQDRCTGTDDQCPITWDSYIVIDGVDQLHPSNVAAGCFEDTYVHDEAGNLISGQWWKATAHGKGYLRACNADGSVCGVSSFEIDQ